MELIERFCSEKSSRTARAYRRDLELFVAHCTAMDLDLIDAQRYHVMSFLETRERRGDGPATIRRRLAALRSFYTHLSAVGIANHAPTAGLTGPAAPRGGAVVSLDDIERCLAVAGRDPDEHRPTVLSLVLFAAYRLPVADVIDLSHTDVVRRDESWSLRGRGPVPPAFRPLLPPPARHAEVMLVSGTGSPPARQSVGRWLRRLGERAGLATPLSPRVLKRSAVSLAVHAGALPEHAAAPDWSALPEADHPANALAAHLHQPLAPWRS